MVEQDFRTYVRMTGAQMDLAQFAEIFAARVQDPRIKIPRAVDRWFQNPASSGEEKIKSLIDEYRSTERSRLEQELFKQTKRLADAERKLAQRTTLAATESKRIASDRILKDKMRLPLVSDFKPHAADSRIFPMHYAPIVIKEHGTNFVKLARYHCRQDGQPATIDKEKDGLYNARRTNLTRWWRNEFAHTHAVMLVTSFYENVEHSGRKSVLQFVPNPASLMVIACLYSEWRGENGAHLLSYAAITDEPPDEVRAAGHDRMIINIQPHNVDRWLDPEHQTVDELQAILSERQRPYYEHTVLAA